MPANSPTHSFVYRQDGYELSYLFIHTEYIITHIFIRKTYCSIFFLFLQLYVIRATGTFWWHGDVLFAT